MLNILSSMIPLALAYTAPLLIIALGGLFSERSGVVNIGLEGLMGIGAFTSAFFISSNYESMGDVSILLGVILGALMGGLFSMIHAFASITMRADQVISGTAINMLSSAITIYLARALTGSANIQIIKGFIKRDVMFLGLSKIPVIGPIFFGNAYITTYVVILIVVVSWYVLYKRPFGLRLRACGEHPQAADSMGINVIRMRYIGVIISGILAGLGGAIVITTYSGEFSGNIYSGLGFLALAALIFGKWKPFGVLGAAVFFGFAKTVADMSQLFESLKTLPNIYFNTFPYVVTIIALVLFSKNSAGPRAAGEPYDAGKR
ncbi:MAG: ral nucleoside transport system permease protein [Epulopiscium sp.]|uniref:ABC transporter permease n=1 Tax=Defluviitalea raffinosedens TaxID=1450156 RepID=A0A7C8HDS0_9FIRM|nr:ABC transporter permease [Defluviitalea raffinosedens]KAE9630268.1 ABC transporter permease [Defluviitalea raffinosedens]MBM7686071.1 simple sugar transport system permease protein [Defluviitalea raffinosedens]MDK2788016.1 ral nucleoside transport system permease protein [Candidatus Epulonipiscium sp.]